VVLKSLFRQVFVCQRAVNVASRNGLEHLNNASRFAIPVWRETIYSSIFTDGWCSWLRVNKAMRTYSYLMICLFVGCGGDPPPPPSVDDRADSSSTAGAGAGADATVSVDAGQPPQREKLPSDDLFATMVQAFVENKGDLYEKADRELDELGAEGIPTYVDALRGGDAESRKLACIKLANLGPDAAPATDDLAAALNDDDPSVRANAASVLSIVPKPPENLVGALRAILQDESGTMWHGMSIVALSNLGTLAEDAVPDLVPFLTSEDAELRRDSVRTMRAIGPASKPFVANIKKLVDDPDEAVSAAATEAVAFIESINRESDDRTDRPTGKVGQATVPDSEAAKEAGPPPLIPLLDLPDPEPATVPVDDAKSDDGKSDDGKGDPEPAIEPKVDN
jgi:HEAT repeat protein